MGSKAGKTGFVIQSALVAVTIKDLVYAIDAVPEAQQHANHGLVYESDATEWKNIILVTVWDASWSNKTEYLKGKPQKHRSQRARMTILANPDFWEKKETSFT